MRQNTNQNNLSGLECMFKVIQGETEKRTTACWKDNKQS